MKDLKQNENASMSASQMRRVARKKEIEKAKRDAVVSKIISTVIIALIAIGFVSLIGFTVYGNIVKVNPSSDYSAYITDQGLIEGVKASDNLKLADYSNLKVPADKVEYTVESLETDIKAALEEYKSLSKETKALIAKDDKVNIDYVGTVDGVEFEGGNTNGQGADLVIGSNSYVDDFEDQLIGHGIGDKVTVEVTFPTEYKTKDLAGKDAVFEVTINGIYVTPELTDDFVKENLSDYASTANEYKEYLKNKDYNKKISDWLNTYLMDNTTVTSYPKEYANHMKSILKYEDQSYYQSMNSLYASLGLAESRSFEQFVGMSESKYDAGLKDDAQDRVKTDMIYQAIAENENITASEAEYDTYFNEEDAEDFDSLVEKYGKGYVMQKIIYRKVIELLKDRVTVE